MGGSVKGNYSLQVKIVVAVIGVPIFWLVYLLQQPVVVSQQAVHHFYYVALSALTAGTVGVFAYAEYKRAGHFKILLLAAGFIGGAVLYAIHGLITPGKSMVIFTSKQEHINAFVFFGDMSRLWIALFFIPQTFRISRKNGQADWRILAAVAVVLAVTSWMLLHHPMLFPQVKHATGVDTYFSVIVKVITVILLVVTTVRFYEGWCVLRNTPVLALVVGSALLAQTPIIFMLSTPWSQAWWLAHNIYLACFIIIGLGLVLSRKYEQIEFFDVLSQAKEFIATIKNQKVELEMLNEKLAEANIALEKIAFTDSLTGAWNRRHFEEVAIIEMERALRYDQTVSLLLFDIDHFKEINDSFGHGVGDRVLVELVSLIKQHIRGSDLFARWGGEEFILLTPNTTGPDALLLGEKIRALAQTHRFDSVGNLTISIGVAEWRKSETLRKWVDRADIALYLAKNDGRNLVRLTAE